MRPVLFAYALLVASACADPPPPPPTPAEAAGTYRIDSHVTSECGRNPSTHDLYATVVLSPFDVGVASELCTSPPEDACGWRREYPESTDDGWRGITGAARLVNNSRGCELRYEENTATVRDDQLILTQKTYLDYLGPQRCTEEEALLHGTTLPCRYDEEIRATRID